VNIKKKKFPDYLVYIIN